MKKQRLRRWQSNDDAVIRFVLVKMCLQIHDEKDYFTFDSQEEEVLEILIFVGHP